VAATNARVLIDDEERAGDADPIQITEHVSGRVRARTNIFLVECLIASQTAHSLDLARVSPREREEHVTRNGEKPRRAVGHDGDRPNAAVGQIVLTDEVSFSQVGNDPCSAFVAGLHLHEPIENQVGILRDVARALDVFTPRDLEMLRRIERGFDLAVGKITGERRRAEEIERRRAPEAPLELGQRFRTVRANDGTPKDDERDLDDRALSVRSGRESSHSERKSERLVTEDVSGMSAPNHGGLGLSSAHRDESARPRPYDIQ
jgi:hypothetical protein